VTKPTYSIDAPDQPRLKIARAEIEAVLQKHDLAGAVVLHTPGMAEFFYRITPSYSCVWIDESVPMLRMKSKLADYGGDRDAQVRDQAATANMAASLAGELRHAAEMFGGVDRIVSTAARAEHTEPEFVPDPLEAKPS
jgi:hypothetical protein